MGKGYPPGWLVHVLSLWEFVKGVDSVVLVVWVWVCFHQDASVQLVGVAEDAPAGVTEALRKKHPPPPAPLQIAALSSELPLIWKECFL